MYYLYKQKPKPNGHGDSSVDGQLSNSIATPVSVHSNVHHEQLQHPPLQQQQQQFHHHNHHQHHNHPISDDPGGDIPEDFIDGSGRHVHPSRRRQQQDELVGERSESKQKDEQVVRRMLRRRGLEEADFTEDVMPPQRPARTACERCQHDISPNDNQHRIICSDRCRHTFCKSCVVNFVNAWVAEQADCELRQGRNSSGAGCLKDLPCMSSSCRRGCLVEAHLQPLLSHELFVNYRQKLAHARTGRTQLRSRSLQEVVSSGSQSAPVRRSQEEEEQVQRVSHEPISQSSFQQNEQQMRYSYPQQEMHHQPSASYEQQHSTRHSYPQQHQYQLGQDIYHFQRQYQHEHGYSLQQHQQQIPQTQHRRQSHQSLSSSHGGGGQVGGSQQQFQPIPGPPALLRRASSSSTATSRRTNKSVRFSLKSESNDDLADNASSSSSGSSASSLTTRFPLSLNGEEHDDQQQHLVQHQHGRKQRQAQHHHHHVQQQPLPPLPEQHEQQQQHLQQGPVTPVAMTCQCCYNEFDGRTSLFVCCDPRNSSTGSHKFCGKCFRLYIEEWLFGAATYTLLPGPRGSDGQTVLVLPCLSGDCPDGGFPDDRVSQALSPRMMNQYLGKINPLRVEKEDEDEKLLKMAIRLSLEQEEIQKRLARLHEEQRSITQEGAAFGGGSAIGKSLPFTAVDVPPTTLSNTSSLTSFNLSIFQSSIVSAPAAFGTTTMRYKTASVEEPQRNKFEQSVHEVEEAMTQAKVRQCPNCMTKFLKDNDFCNKLRCPSCRTAICYICRHVIPTQGYEHFCIHKQGGCGACLGLHCALWTTAEDDDKRDIAEMRARGLDEANRIWEESLLQKTQQQDQSGEIRVDVDRLMQGPPRSPDREFLT